MYSLDSDGKVFSKVELEKAYDGSRTRHAHEQYVNQSGVHYTYKKSIFQRGKIVDQYGNLIYVETVYNYVANALKSIQVFAFMFAIIMISSNGRPVLFFKIANKQVPKTGKMSLSPRKFDENVVQYYSEIR